MTGTKQKKFIAVILTLAMLISFMPAMTLTAKAESTSLAAPKNLTWDEMRPRIRLKTLPAIRCSCIKTVQPSEAR